MSESEARSNKARGGEQGVKVPKGTRDINPKQAAVREKVMERLVAIFKRHGGVTIETPVFELRDTLMGKYGEDSKLIYDLKDQGGEICSLRYDLTVPFARYVAMNNLDHMKRFHIAKVYRRDQPAMNRGRFREFYQCDFDIAGTYDPMLPDAECCKMMTEILTSIEVGAFCIKLNHRKLLDGIFEICGVPADKFRPICSAVDKLDKEPWETVRQEMVETKGLDPIAADKIGQYVCIKGKPADVLAKLKGEGLCEGSESAMTALAEMDLLFQYLDTYNVHYPNVCFDLSLARGLDYYTGLIYEAVLTDTDRVGSIAGGGRYDELVGMYGKRKVPCVGFSIGIERLFSILEEKHGETIRESPTDVFVMSPGKGMAQERMRLLCELWDGGIRAEHMYKANPNMKRQFEAAQYKGVPFCCIIGENEVKEGIVNVKDQSTGQQETVSRAKLVSYLRGKLGVGAETGTTTSVPIPGFESLGALNSFLLENSFVEGSTVSKADMRVFTALGACPDRSQYPHAARFYRTLAALSEQEKTALLC